MGVLGPGGGPSHHSNCLFRGCLATHALGPTPIIARPTTHLLALPPCPTQGGLDLLDRDAASFPRAIIALKEVLPGEMKISAALMMHITSSRQAPAPHTPPPPAQASTCWTWCHASLGCSTPTPSGRPQTGCERLSDYGIYLLVAIVSTVTREGRFRQRQRLAVTSSAPLHPPGDHQADVHLPLQEPQQEGRRHQVRLASCGQVLVCFEVCGCNQQARQQHPNAGAVRGQAPECPHAPRCAHSGWWRSTRSCWSG